MINGWRIHGHAIVSDDDRIAAADGTVPPTLFSEADWMRFQSALDEAVMTVLGRRGHGANPNRKKRRRLVLSSSASGIERRADTWWWNPVNASAGDALSVVSLYPGVAAVVGGRRVFDLFLRLGFDEFHLARAAGVKIPGGIPIFSSIIDGLSAWDVLQRHGLDAAQRRQLDDCVSLTVWRRA